MQEPWRLLDVDVNMLAEMVTVYMEHDPACDVFCPVCNATAWRYDAYHRSWRHLDTMQFKTVIEADIPRVECSLHGVLQVTVPWTEYKSRFTSRFEALVIDWLQEAPTSAVADALGLRWYVIDVNCQRAVESVFPSTNVFTLFTFHSIMRILFSLMLVAASLLISSCSSSTDSTQFDAKTNLAGKWTFTRADKTTFTADISVNGSELIYNKLKCTATFDGPTAIGKNIITDGSYTWTTTLTIKMTSATTLDFKQDQLLNGMQGPIATYTGVKQ